MASPKPLPATLVRARIRARLTIIDLARVLGRSPRTIARWEDGSTTPSATDVLAFVDAIAAYDAHVATWVRESLALPPPPPTPASVAERRRDLTWILYAAADEADVSPKRLRAAIAQVARGAAASGFSIDEVHALLTE